MLIALICTLSLLLIFSFSRLYRRLPFRPLIDFSTFIISCFLLLQGLTTLELFA
ncbi:putative membrane protein [Shigella flexneri 1235-66]|nr:putative membrane protein [Shigella flexneri 1235-66]